MTAAAVRRPALGVALLGLVVAALTLAVVAAPLMLVAFAAAAALGCLLLTALALAQRSAEGRAERAARARVARLRQVAARGEPILTVTGDARDIGRLAVLAHEAHEVAPADDRLRDALVRSGAVRAVVRMVHESRRPRARVAALRAAAWLSPAESVPVLAGALGDDEPAVANTAAQLLGGLERMEAYEALLVALAAGRLPGSRAATLLEGSPLAANAAVSLSRWASHRDPRVRFWVAYLLGRSGDHAAVGTLQGLAADGDDDVRCSAAEGLGTMPTDAAAPALERLLRDASWVVRAHAAKAAARHPGEPPLIDGLAALLRDRTWWVRDNAARALERVGRPAIGRLETSLEGDDRFARNRAAEVLVRLGYLAEQVDLLDVADNGDGARRRLVAVGRAEALEGLHRAALAAEPRAQDRLVTALAEIDDPRSLATLSLIARSGRPRVSDHARQVHDRIASRSGLGGPA
jgi:HEAT repeat protein